MPVSPRRADSSNDSTLGKKTTEESIFRSEPSTLAMRIVAARAEYAVEVEGSKGNLYTVRFNVGSNSGWSCTCPHFQFRGIECKHIKHVKEDSNAGTGAGVPSEKRGGTGGELFPQENMEGGGGSRKQTP